MAELIQALSPNCKCTLEDLKDGKQVWDSCPVCAKDGYNWLIGQHERKYPVTNANNKLDSRDDRLPPADSNQKKKSSIRGSFQHAKRHASAFLHHKLFPDIFKLVGDITAAFPPRYQLFFGILYTAGALAFFIWLFIIYYTPALSQQYLAPFPSDGYPDDNCEAVSLSNTGIYLATPQGAWEGTANYIPSNATYSFTFVSAIYTIISYAKMMDMIYRKVEEVGALAKKQIMTDNLLYWMTYSYPLSDNKRDISNRFEFTGDPRVVFNRKYSYSSLVSIKGVCPVTSSIDYKPFTGQFTVSYSSQDFSNAQDICFVNTNEGSEKKDYGLDPYLFGYPALNNPPMFSFSFDVRSLVSSISITRGITKLERMVEVFIPGDNRVNFEFQGTEYTTGWFYHPKFPGNYSLHYFVYSRYML